MSNGNIHNPDRRCDDEMRTIIERAAEAGAVKAMEKFSELTPFDLTKKEGRDDFRGVMYHAWKLKRTCDNVIQQSRTAAVAGALSIGGLVIMAGILYLLGIDPEQLRLLDGR